MQTIEIDPELNRRALAEAAEKYPEFAGRALRVVARPLFQGFAWQLEWDGIPRPGSPRGSFKTLPFGRTRDWPASTGNLAPCRCRINTPATRNHFGPARESGISPYSALAGPHLPAGTIGDFASTCEGGPRTEFVRSSVQQGTCDIGLIGLAVMGQNLVLNMNDHGYRVAVSTERSRRSTTSLRTKRRAPGGRRALDRRTGGAAEAAAPRHADGQSGRNGRSNDRHRSCLTLKRATSSSTAATRCSPDTNRRTKSSAEKGILFIGPASRAAKKARALGPSIMPGGNPAAWPHVKEIFQAIAAKVEDGTPCCDWVGEDGAGHYVKMVHNGIEYGDMQLICEAYQLLKDGLGLTADELHEVFAEWNKGELDSYLIEITRDIFGDRRMKTARRWSTRFSTPPVRRVPGNGPASVRSIWACPSR